MHCDLFFSEGSTQTASTISDHSVWWTSQIVSYSTTNPQCKNTIIYSDFLPRCFLPCAKTPSTVRLRLLHSTAPFKLTPINKMKISKCIESNFYIGSVKNILEEGKKKVWRFSCRGKRFYQVYYSFDGWLGSKIFAFIYQRKKKSRRKSLG